MKSKKLLLSILTPTAVIVPTISGLALTSCNPMDTRVTVKVGNVYELRSALRNRSIEVISLVDNISLDLAAATESEGLLINRSVAIEGNGFKIYSYNERERQVTDKSLLSMIRITKPSDYPDEGINVTFHNVKLEMASKYQNGSIVYIDDGDFCNVTFNQTIINYKHDSTHNCYYCLTISNRVTRGCNVTITNGSEFTGWGAIYNRGSNVNLTARYSRLIGENRYAANPGNIFATVTVSDYPIKLPHHTRLGRNSWGANNYFNFISCELVAIAPSGTTSEAHQFVIQNRCPANNVIAMDSVTLDQTSSYMTAENKPWFASSFKVGDVTDENIDKYYYEVATDEMPVYTRYDMPRGIIDEYTYYKYYTDNKIFSRFVVDGQEITRRSVGHFKYYNNLKLLPDGNHQWTDEQE